MEWVKGKTTQFTMTNIEEGENKTVSFQIPEFEAPIAAGMMNSPAKTDSKGLGTDREILQYVKDVSLKELKLSSYTQAAIAREIATPL